MKSNELRIGNYVSLSGEKVLKVIEITTVYFYAKDEEGDNFKNTWAEIEPIPLTEELLLRFGFEKIVYDSEETGYGTDYYLKCSNDVFMCYSDDFSLGLFASEESKKDDLGVLPIWKSINTVHGLQNLYFALTGEELKNS